MSKNPRFLWYLLGFVTASLLLAACGIEDFALLNPPEQIINAGDELFEFRKTDDNSEDYFRGFELYYKIYRSSDSPVVDVFTFPDLAVKGFRRIHSSNDRMGLLSKPLMAIDVNDLNDVFVITVDFGTVVPLTDPYPRFDHEGGVDTVFQYNTSIRRGVNYTETGKEDEYKKFSEFGAEDVGKDITSDIWAEISGGIPVKIVLYVVSYGFDIGDFKVVYSEPVYLGEVSRIFL